MPAVLENLAQEKLEAVVLAHGGEPANVYAFERDEAALLPYATLQAARLAEPGDLAPVLGVYEWQGAPLMVLVDGDRLSGEKHLGRIRRVVALRGDVPYLGVLAGGRLTVHLVGLDRRAVDAVEVDRNKVDPSVLLPHLAALRPDVRPLRSTVSDVVLRLLDGALHELRELNLSETDAISLAGRALFARFLADRDLPLGPHLEGRSTEAAFGDAASAKLTSKWLDENFNGNLLPLSNGLFDRLPPQAFGVLVDIMRRAPDGQMSLGWEQRWDNLHFAHIPVGVLSQVYERYLKRYQSDRQKKEGSFYTPAHVADLMVRAAFAGIAPEERHRARVLDPSVGGGVFLITAFRQLVAERWLHDGVRPGTSVLRRILYDQIAGFDVNEAALRFAALSLYLVSVELDPDPEPISKLGFEDLRGLVLHRPESEATIQVGKNSVSLGRLGSLGPAVGPEHRARYDIVIGNPPWKTGARLEGWEWVDRNTSRIAGARLGGELQRGLLPNEALDLPFVWRATEWARPGGQIAFALHGRLLFQQGEGMPQARAAIFSGLDVTSVINGAGLRRTRVWPQITAPFCILFARNRPAPPGATFRFLSPRVEASAKKSGVLRIDASRAPLVRVEEMNARAHLLKILFRGSELDLEIYERLSAASHPELLQTVTKAGGISGNGVQDLRESSRPGDDQDSLPGVDASELVGMPYLADGVPAPVVRASTLPRFEVGRVHRKRSVEIFRGPLLIVGKTLRVGVAGFSCGLSLGDVVYRETCYGYSFRGCAEGERLAFYLQVILRSSLARWWTLMTSGEFGFERDVVEKAAIDKMPLPAFEDLGGDLLNELDTMYTKLMLDALEQGEIEEFVAKIYGLQLGDRQLISDTLAHSLEDDGWDQDTINQDKSSSLDTRPFLLGLRTELTPWTTGLGEALEVDDVSSIPTPAWHFVVIRRGRDELRRPPLRQYDLNAFVQAADATASTEVYHLDGLGGLWIGMLARPRYWTYSQGIRAARHLIWQHVDFLVGANFPKAVAS